MLDILLIYAIMSIVSDLLHDALNFNPINVSIFILMRNKIYVPSTEYEKLSRML